MLLLLPSVFDSDDVKCSLNRKGEKTVFRRKAERLGFKLEYIIIVVVVIIAITTTRNQFLFLLIPTMQEQPDASPHLVPTSRQEKEVTFHSLRKWPMYVLITRY